MKIQRKLGPSNIGQLGQAAGARREQAGAEAAKGRALGSMVGAVVGSAKETKRDLDERKDRAEMSKALTSATLDFANAKTELLSQNIIDDQDGDEKWGELYQQQSQEIKGKILQDFAGTERAREELERNLDAHIAKEQAAINAYAVQHEQARLQTEGMASINALTELGKFAEAKLVADELREGGFLDAEQLRGITSSLTEQSLLRDVQDTMRARFHAGEATAYLSEIDADEGLRDTPERQRKIRETALRTLEILALEDRQAEIEAEAQRKALLEAGEKQATLRLLDGTLTQGQIRDMVADEVLDPTLARTLNNAIKQGDQVVSDDETLFIARTNLLYFTERDIATMPGLSFKDRGDLIEQHRAQSAGWRGTNNAREAAARIDRALEIPPGTVAATLSKDTLQRRGRALSAWFDSVAAMGPEQREAQAIPMAQQVIETIVQEDGRRKLARLEADLETFQRSKNPADMGGYELEEYEQTLESRRARIAELRAKLSNSEFKTGGGF